MSRFQVAGRPATAWWQFASSTGRPRCRSVERTVTLLVLLLLLSLSACASLHAESVEESQAARTGAEADADSGATPLSQAAPPEVRHFAFSGYDWVTVSSPELRGPGPNIFDGRNVDLDSAGRLVLQTAWRGKRWTSAHVFLTRSLGYGRYELVLAGQPLPLDDGTVFGFFTWDDNPDFANREIDIELARWAQPASPLLNFAVQPTAADSRRVILLDFDFSQAVRLSFEWRPDSVRFAAEQLDGSGRVEWVFPEPGYRPLAAAGSDLPAFAVPPKGRERVGINLWLFRGAAPARSARLVVESFSFTPLSRL
ncbi:MAG: hypothetical protein KKC64_02345 [Spirochaetes bacterium]|nr:hypothetical protein [Spirochaetota bacterium]